MHRRVEYGQRDLVQSWLVGRRPGRGGVWTLLLIGLFGCFQAAERCGAQDLDPASETPKSSSPPVATARLLTVPLPITGSVDQQVKRAITQLLNDAPATGERMVLVLEFQATAEDGEGGSQFGRALELARFLTSREVSRRARTVAFIPQAVRGHAVLVALACEEIVIAEDGFLGHAGQDEQAIGPTVRRGYVEIAESRQTIPPNLALGMLDPRLHIYRVTTAGGTRYVRADELETLRHQGEVRQAETVIPAGEMGGFRGDQLRSLGFASYLAENHDELARVLKVPREQLEFDPSMGGAWRAIRLVLSGPITTQSVNRVMRGIEQEQSRGINFICLEINSPGGSAKESVRLANFLAGLDRARIRTVAYIPHEARADAAIVGFACDQAVVHPDAVIGGTGATAIRAAEGADLHAPLRQIGQMKGRPWSLTAAMVDPQLTVYRFLLEGNNQAAYFSEQEWEAQPRPERWTRGAEVTTPGQVLQLDGKRAEQWDWARYTVEGFAQFRQLFQLEESPELVGPNWAYDLIEALAAPQLASILLFVGAFALIAEASSPGIGIGGFISALCFLLFFWANFLNGTAAVLEILLFLTGLTFIAIEIFAIPGFGICGLGGGALVVVSLVLASQTFVVPTNEYQLQQLPGSLAVVAAAGAGLITSMVVLRKYLHRTPLLGRVFLAPPSGDELEDLLRRESIVHYDHLLGEVGTTTTRLAPSGKALFGDELIDVISDGQVIDKGAPVRIIEVTGNRVLVDPL